MLEVLEFCFSSFWVWAGATLWLVLLVTAIASFGPVVVVRK